MVYAAEAGLWWRYGSCRLAHRLRPLEKPRRLLVPVSDAATGKAVADPAGRPDAEDGTGKASKEDPEGEFCQMLSTVHARLTPVIALPY